MRKRIVSTLLALCLVLMLLPGTAGAVTVASGNCGSEESNVTWNLESNGTLTISGNGKMADYNGSSHTVSPSNGPWMNLREQIKEINIETTVEHIGKYSFEDSPNLVRVNVASGATSIGAQAFHGCQALEKITIPDSVASVGLYAFTGCSSLSTAGPIGGGYNIEFGWTNKIPAYAFIACIGLTSINIPNSIIEIENLAFASTKISNVVIPNSVIRIAPGAFRSCNLLTSVTISQSVKSIEQQAFGDCDNLTDVYYGGTKEQWENITIESGNEDLTSATIHFSAPPAPQTYDLKYDLNGGTGDVPGDMCVDSGTKLNLATTTPVREGYTFAGWSDGSTTYQPGTEFVMPNHDVTFTAQWTKDAEPKPTYTVSYSLGAVSIDAEIKGTIPEPKSYAPGVTVTVTDADIISAGEKFTGWVDGTDFYPRGSTFLMPEHDVHLSANMRKIYDIAKVRDFAENHWNTNAEWLCARFVAHCVQAGGLALDAESQPLGNVDACITELCEVSGLQMENLNLAPNAKVNVDPGDVVIQHCNACGKNLHMMICIGYENGQSLFCAHNPSWRSGWWNNIYGGNHHGHSASHYVIRLSKLAYNQKNLTTSNFATDCPVEMVVTVQGEVLDSRTIEAGTISNAYAFMETSGSGQDRKVSVTVIGEQIEKQNAHIEFIGTDNGLMDLTVTHLFDDSSTDSHVFHNVPLTSTSTGYISRVQPQVFAQLVMQEGGSDKIWTAFSGETVTVPDKTPTTSDNPTPIYPDIPWIPSTPSRPTTPTKPSTPSTTTPVTPPAETKPEDTAPETPPSTPAVTLPFTDVSPADWFYPSVQYVYEKSLMTGDGSPTIFNPSGSMTRAMVWTVLGRIAGADVSGSGSEWFAKAQAWAVAEGVSDGSNPNGGVARQELVTMLWRSAGSPTAAADLSGFSDGGDVAGWAGTAMQWAVSNAVLSGDNGALKPAAPASRAEVAAILTQFCQYRAA